MAEPTRETAIVVVLGALVLLLGIGVGMGMAIARLFHKC
jgi:hypothetical protein